MMSWYKVEITPEQFENNEHWKIRDEFRAIWMSPPAAREYFDMALLESSPRPDSSIVLYFSPVATKYLRELN